MELIGLELPLVGPGDDLVASILEAAKKIGGLKKDDVLVVASKVMATAGGELEELSKVRPSRRAKALAKRSDLPPEFVEIIIHEADEILGVSKGAILTIKNGVLSANAGADRSNVPDGFVALIPSRPDSEAGKIRQEISKRAGVKVGVIVADSNVKPLRMGTVGQAIGFAGIEPVVDYRGQLDVHGKPLRITFQAIADQLATAAQVVMGEGGERIPVVVARGVKKISTENPKFSPKIAPSKDLYSGMLKFGGEI